VAAVSYDRPEVLAHFAERKNIPFPLLSDPDSKVIRAFGILNEEIPAGDPAYGVPYPGVFVVDAEGIVRGKFFEEDYWERYTPGAILAHYLGALGRPVGEAETRHLSLRWYASDDAAAPGSRIRLTVEVSLKAGMHVYAPGVEGGYIPIRWDMEKSPAWRAGEVTYPEPQKLFLKAIEETVPAYKGKLQLQRDVWLGTAKDLAPVIRGEGELVLRGSFFYQACDERMCYRPERVPLEWKVRILELDRTRVPESLRRGR